MKRLKVSLLVLTSLLAAGTAVVIACAGGDWDETEGSMFAPELINKPAYEPFFRSQYLPFYKTGFYTDQLTACNTLNVKEWGQYFEGKVTDEVISYWLYKAEPKEVNNMLLLLKGTTKSKPVLNDDSKKFSFIGFQPTDKATAFLYYVGFAKRNETFTATEVYSWGDKVESPATVSITSQIEGGMKFFNNAKNPLLKERYLYQIIRLYYFNKQFSEAIGFYEANKTLFSDKTSMKWRSLEYIAGAYYKKNDYSKANYLFSLIYDKFPEHKQSAYLSFHPQEEKDWKQALNLAANTREKAVLWQMLGIYRDPKRAVEEIYKLDPASDLLDLLLVRIVNTKEEQFNETVFRKTSEKYTFTKKLLMKKLIWSIRLRKRVILRIRSCGTLQQLTLIIHLEILKKVICF